MRVYSYICTSISTHTQVSMGMYEEWLVGWLAGWLFIRLPKGRLCRQRN